MSININHQAVVYWSRLTYHFQTHLLPTRRQTSQGAAEPCATFSSLSISRETMKVEVLKLRILSTHKSVRGYFLSYIMIYCSVSSFCNLKLARKCFMSTNHWSCKPSNPLHIYVSSKIKSISPILTSQTFHFEFAAPLPDAQDKAPNVRLVIL